MARDIWYKRFNNELQSRHNALNFFAIEPPVNQAINAIVRLSHATLQRCAHMTFCFSGGFTLRQCMICRQLEVF